jgi:hypothetical protein
MESILVEVFKTNVQHKQQAEVLLNALLHAFPLLDTHFDLDDCDKVLRVEGMLIEPDIIIGLLNTHGFQCTILPESPEHTVV